MIDRNKDRRDLHHKVLNSVLSTWTKDDLVKALEILREKDIDLDMQLQEVEDLEDDEITPEDEEWENRASHAWRYIKIAKTKVKKELARREKTEHLTPSQVKAYEEMMEDVKRQSQHLDRAAQRLKACRRVIHSLREELGDALNLLPGTVRAAMDFVMAGKAVD